MPSTATASLQLPRAVPRILDPPASRCDDLNRTPRPGCSPSAAPPSPHAGYSSVPWRPDGGTSADRLLVGGTLVISSIPFLVVRVLADLPVLQLQIFRTPGTTDTETQPRRELHDAAVAGESGANCTSYARYAGQMVETLSETTSARRVQGVKTNNVLFKHALRSGYRARDHDLRPRLRDPPGGTIFTEQISNIDGSGMGPAGPHDRSTFNVISATRCWCGGPDRHRELLVDILLQLLDLG